MRALAVVMTVVVATGCTLLLDVDAVVRGYDAGSPGDAGPQFQAQQCTAHLPLECLSFTPDGGSGAFGLSSLTPIDGGFLAALERHVPHRIELYSLDLAGWSPLLKDWPVGPAESVSSLSLSAAGDAWAVAWVGVVPGQLAATTVQCVSGTSLTALPPTSSPVNTDQVDFASVAVNATGQVALGASWQYDFGSIDIPLRSAVAQGCPTALVSVDGGAPVMGVTALSLPDAGFVVVATGYAFTTYQAVNGAFVSTATGTTPYVASGPQSATFTADGGLVTLVGWSGTAGPGLYTAPTGLGADYVVQDVDIFKGLSPGVWGNGPCGGGCLANVMVPADPLPADVLVAFTDDRTTATPLGADTFTVACHQSSALHPARSVHTAWNLGLLGVLYSDDGHAAFSLCRVPSF